MIFWDRSRFMRGSGELLCMSYILGLTFERFERLNGREMKMG